jgi:hypothetical protein
MPIIVAIAVWACLRASNLSSEAVDIVIVMSFAPKTKDPPRQMPRRVNIQFFDHRLVALICRTSKIIFTTRKITRPRFGQKIRVRHQNVC